MSANQIEIHDHWVEGSSSDQECAQLIRACLRHETRLLHLDAWLPFPQTSCSFAFGQDMKPLPIGALYLLWKECPQFTRTCKSCSGRVYGFTFGGLLNIGGVNGCCIECSHEYSNRLGGFPFMATLVRRYLEGTEYRIPRMSYGGCFSGPREPLYRALRRLGERDLPNPFWMKGKGEPGVSLRVGRTPVRIDFDGQGGGGAIP